MALWEKNGSRGLRDEKSGNVRYSGVRKAKKKEDPEKLKALQA